MINLNKTMTVNDFLKVLIPIAIWGVSVEVRVENAAIQREHNRSELMLLNDKYNKTFTMVLANHKEVMSGLNNIMIQLEGKVDKAKVEYGNSKTRY